VQARYADARALVVDIDEVLRLAGRPRDAAAAARDAVALYERKGIVSSGRRAGAVLEDCLSDAIWA
jgi:hypothetical protein